MSEPTTKKPATRPTKPKAAPEPTPEVKPTPAKVEIPAVWEDHSPLASFALLREPFPERSIALLPQPIRRFERNDPKYTCVASHQEFRQASKDGLECGGRHFPSIHLSYVGHAEMTDRLLAADPFWSWEPLALDGYGLPLFDEFGGLWIKLTVRGHTRLGYGDAQNKTGPNARKEVIGDALRNAAMRFGVALDLWAKTDLHESALKRDGVIDDQPPAPTNHPNQGTNAPQRPAQPAQRPGSFEQARAEWERKLDAATTQEDGQAIWLEARSDVQRGLLDKASLDALSQRYQQRWGAKQQEQAGEPTTEDAARQEAAGEPEPTPEPKEAA